jgi:hypothetical protein
VADPETTTTLHLVSCREDGCGVYLDNEPYNADDVDLHADQEPRLLREDAMMTSPRQEKMIESHITF